MISIGIYVMMVLGGSITQAQSIGHECLMMQSILDDEGNIRTSILEGQGPMVAEELYPLDAIIMATKNMQYACCIEGYLSSEQCPREGGYNGSPTSVSLFDHVLNIGMRRMSGDPAQVGNDEALLDPLAYKRRQRINTQGVNPGGTPPGLILNRFYTDVMPSTQDKAIAQDQAVVVGDAEKIICDELPIYESLNYRIQQQCAIAYCVTEGITARARLAGSVLVDQGLQIPYHTCLAIQQERVIAEYDTTTNIMKAQANVLSQRAQEAYLQNYFVNTRMTTLAEKLTKQISLLEIINSKYTEGTKMCN